VAGAATFPALLRQKLQLSSSSILEGADPSILSSPTLFTAH
jgi:hypothetical protein